MQEASAATGNFEIVYGLLRKVAIGDVSLKNVPVYLRKFHEGNQGVDGYIGLALISKFLTTIDYGKQHIFAYKKNLPTNASFKRTTTLSLPLRLTSSGFLSGEVQLEGIDAMLNFIVDTGASVSVISNRVAKTDGISPFVNDEKMRVIGSAGITDDVSSFHAAERNIWQSYAKQHKGGRSRPRHHQRGRQVLNRPESWAEISSKTIA